MGQNPDLECRFFELRSLECCVQTVRNYKLAKSNQLADIFCLNGERAVNHQERNTKTSRQNHSQYVCVVIILSCTVEQNRHGVFKFRAGGRKNQKSRMEGFFASFFLSAAIICTVLLFEMDFNYSQLLNGVRGREGKKGFHSHFRKCDTFYLNEEHEQPVIL